MGKIAFGQQETSLIHTAPFVASASDAHSHITAGYDLMLVLHQGQLWFDEGGAVTSAGPGDAVYHPQGIPYEEWSSATDPVHCLKVLFRWPSRPRQIVRKVSDANGLLRQISERLAQVWWQEEENGGRAGRMLLEGLVGEYLALAGSEVAPLVRQVRQYAWEHLREGFQLSDLAAHFSLNPHYFARKFQKEAGYGPMAEVRHLRLEQAKKLALTTDLQVKAIAKQVGFPNASYLSRLFASHYNMTIRQLRNSVIKR